MPMDICSHIGLPATDNINDLQELCMNALESTNGVLNVHSVDELGVNVTKFLNIQDAGKDDSSSSSSPKSCEFQNKDMCSDSHQRKIMNRAPEKCLSKHATFPCSGKTLSPQDVIMGELSTRCDNVKFLDPSGFRSTSLPAHLKPVSAMKGSREKRGATPPVKLTVKWAPDVYDPIPTSVSHVVTHNRSSRHSKKNSKNKQKNGSKSSSSSSSSRGTKSKDKKQVRKRGGNSCGSGYKLSEHEEELVDFREHESLPGGVDFHVGNSDQLCGSSFMKRYGTSLHLSSVAEAT